MSGLQKLILFFLLTAVGMALFGCGSDESAREPSIIHTYDVRGVLRQLPRADATQPEIWIHHEEIPTFVDINGEPKGMESMTMPFIPASELSLADLVVGDKVTFRLQVDWQATPPATVIRIDKLPPDTVLEWEAGTDDS